MQLMSALSVSPSSHLLSVSSAAILFIVIIIVLKQN